MFPQTSLKVTDLSVNTTCKQIPGTKVLIGGFLSWFNEITVSGESVVKEDKHVTHCCDDAVKVH